MSDTKKPSTSTPANPTKVVIKESPQTDSRTVIHSKDTRPGGIEKPKH